MDNPFLRRATEFLRDDEAFLAIVTPEPVTLFLKNSGESGRLYDRLVLMRGTPGSGKTTLARLFEYPTLSALLRNRNISNYQALVGALASCGAILDENPTVVGCRLALETDYRDFWEVPYSDTLKIRLMTALIQARSVIAWLRHISGSGLPLAEIGIVPKPGSEGLLETVGGPTCEGVIERARQVERALYRVMGALVPPQEAELPTEARETYQPFDIIDGFELPGLHSGATPINLKPLVILDDAHVLHPVQFELLQRFFMRRELRLARWIISRLDALGPQEALSMMTEEGLNAAHYPGLSQDREVEVVLLQSSGARRENRTNFRRMAKDMARRYMHRMPLLNSRNLHVLGDLLAEDDAEIPASSQKQLEDRLGKNQVKLKISDERRRAFLQDVTNYRAGKHLVPPDLACAMISIMMFRHEKRISGPSLFAQEDPEPSKPVVANSSVYEAARLHLLHAYERPYFRGIDDLCDASSENAEQFLQLAAVLVETIATQIIRSKPALLSSETQNRLLRKRGAEIMAGWNFPYYALVRRLVDRMALRCQEVSLLPNGWLTPNAFGVLQSEFDKLTKTQAELAQVLKFGAAYNALTIVPQHQTKGKTWCLVEVGGMVSLAHGLTLKRGGFIESSVRELSALARETS